MKTTVFVRPNLKVFLLAAILLVVVQHLITSVHSQAPMLSAPVSARARDVTDAQLDELLRHAAERPTSQLYTLISHCYEKRGEYRKAILYLRRAEKIGQTQEPPE
jgi:hypothetical protein